jgi:hypothetical protein
MGILRAIKQQHFDAISRHSKWAFTYWAFDLHGTIIKPNYTAGSIPTEFYPHAKKVLQMLSKRDDIVMYMYTCSHPHEQEQYVELFKQHDIDFKWVNKNPDVQTDNNGYGYYEEKPYFNVLFEDKAGFDPNEDWEDIWDYFRGRHSFILRTFFKFKRLIKNGF